MSSLHKLPRAGASYEEVTRQVDDLVDGMTPEQSGKLSSTAFWGIGDALQIAKETHVDNVRKLNGLGTRSFLDKRLFTERNAG